MDSAAPHPPGPSRPTPPSPTPRTRRALPVVAARASLVFLALLILVATLPAAADWLVTREGERIETQGSWKIRGKAIFYTTAEGESARIPRDAVNLEASRRATRGEEPKVVMYSTPWCPYCRKARKLLNKLDVEWVEKNIEKDPAAARELRLKAGRGAGVPVIDFDGKLVRGYDPKKITKLAQRIEEQRERAKR